MGTYIYEATIENIDGDWLVTVPAFGEDSGCYGGGRTLRKAVLNASEALRLTIAGWLDGGRKLPSQTLHASTDVILCVEVDDAFVASSKCMTVKQAAEELGITAGRVSQLARSGGLDSVVIDGRRMVTIASVNERKRNPPAAHRPAARLPQAR